MRSARVAARRGRDARGAHDAGRHLGATGGAALSMTLVRNAGWGEFVEPGLGRVGDAGEDMQLVRRAFEKKRGGYGAEMLLGAGY